MNRDGALAHGRLIIVLTGGLEGHLEALIGGDLRRCPNGQFSDGRDAVFGNVLGDKGASRERKACFFEFSGVGDGDLNLVVIVAVVLELEGNLGFIAFTHGSGALIGNVQIDHAKGGDVEVAAHRGV